MKKLILCEGPNEKVIIDILLENNLLIINKDDLIGLQPYHARQIDKAANISVAIKTYNQPFEILRIGDSLTDKLRIPKDFKEKVLNIKKYCTKPELEFLLIISENLLNDYAKSKLKKPKLFAKQNIILTKHRYDNSCQFCFDYYGNRPNTLVDALREYKRIKNHDKDELYLFDLIKKDN